MVQLKETVCNDLATPIDLFQFLYGTIKSYEISAVAANLIKFQFLYGTIKRKMSRIRRRNINFISIPLWYN